MIINHTEILIVGSGIVGLAHALACDKRGKKVLVIGCSGQIGSRLTILLLKYVL